MEPKELADPIESARQIIEETSVNLFLTGKAGTGKTTFLQSLSRDTSKRHVVLAPTGVAAINAGGVTIHSFFQLSFAPFIPGRGFANSGKERYQKFSKTKLKLIRTLDLIIIDEISMVRPDLLDAVDSVLRRLRNPLKPFGGVQLLLIGDLRQLAPVAQDEEWQYLKEYYPSPYFFESHALREAGFLMVELKKVYRQSDRRFIGILNSIRDNRADRNTLADLNSRADLSLIKGDEDDYIRLTTHNYRADRINNERLGALSGTPVTFRAEIKDDFPESAYPADPELTLKVGAKVMFIKNDVSGNHEYYNGLLGHIVDLSDSQVVVRPVGKETDIKVGRVAWERIKYTVNKDGEIVETPEGTFSQIPLRLAWSITIHKSQGLTFEKAIIDAARSFAPGQTYVALSRCRSLDGLILDAPLSPSAIRTDPAVNSFIELHPRVEGSAEELDHFKEAYLAEVLFELFDFRIIDEEIDTYYRAAATVLGREHPDFVDKISDAMKQFQLNVTDVAAKLHSLFRSGLPRRHEEAVAEVLRQKISGGAGYFIPRLDELLKLIQATPLSIRNKAMKARMETASNTLFESLKIKLRLLEHFRQNEFEPAEYLKLKTRILLDKKS
ncbi:MAG: AAA family ATPase [Bacteroides sp.]|nr:AAA family ATPase [Bacteroides sp.]